MTQSQPPITATTHPLPFHQLSPRDFERLCLWLIQREGYERAEHLGAAGSEQGRDLIAWHGGEQWAFQCKRVQRFGPKDALKEVEKVLALPEAERPVGIVFLVTCDVSANTRQQARERCVGEMACHFWTGTELDAKVQRHPDIVERFFALQVPVLPTIPFAIVPIPLTDFTGREKELKKLERILIRGEGQPRRIAGIAGSAGVGKSALSSYFAEQSRAHFPDGTLCLSVRGNDARTIAHRFARLVGEEFDLDDLIEPSTIMQLVFRPRRMLLILDDADDAEIEALRPGGDCCAALVTTRDRDLLPRMDIPSDAQVILHPFPIEDALALLAKIIGDERLDAESDTAREIISLVGALPLALRITGSTLRKQKGRSLRAYADLLLEEQGRLARLKYRDLDVRASFTLSLKMLSEDEISFFASLSACAADGFSLNAAAATAGVSTNLAEDHLWHLHSLSLLNKLAVPNRFSLHTLLHLFAGELAEEQGIARVAREQQAEYMMAWLKQHDLETSEGLRAIELELRNVLRAAQWLVEKRSLDSEFLIALYSFVDLTGHYEEAMELSEQFVELAEIQNNRELVSYLNWYQGRHLTRQGHFEVAMSPLQHSRVISADLGNRQMLSLACISLGKALRGQGYFPAAVEAYQEGKSIGEEIGNQRVLALALNGLGTVRQEQGHLEEAVGAFRRSLAIHEQLGNQRDVAVVLSRLGTALRYQGRLEEATEALKRSLAICEELGNRRDVAEVLNSLGAALRHQGCLEEATEAFERALAIHKKLGGQRDEAIVLNSLGTKLQDQGHFEEAVEAFERALAIHEKLGNQSDAAKVLNSLGTALRHQGHFDEAIDAFERALAIHKESGGQRNEAIVFNSLGTTLRDQGHFEEAIEAFGRALAIHEKLGNQSDAAIVLNSLVLGTKLPRRADRSLGATAP